MVNSNFWGKIILSIVLIFNLTNTCLAQATGADYTGSISKYDAAFNGIGPEVYYLPAPKSIQEQFQDIFISDKRIHTAAKIDLDLSFQRVLARLQQSPDRAQYAYLIQPAPTSIADWQTKLSHILPNYEAPVQSTMLNEAAIYAFQNKHIAEVQQFLDQALALAYAQKDREQMYTLQNNLAVYYRFIGRSEEAEKIAQDQYESAVSNKNLKQQADAWLNIALARASAKNYAEAENNIIRKAIPLYNKAKDYEGKVIAWEYLAQVYFDQNKFTETQWFLLQAQELAKSKNITKELAEIEYLLASSKLADKNYQVSKKEFLKAITLASGEDNSLLELAVHDKLSEVYFRLHDLDNTQLSYRAYLDLKAKLYEDLD